MKTNQSTPLSNEGSFEKIINDNAQRSRKQAERRFTNLLTAIVLLLLAELVNLILWVAIEIPSGTSLSLSFVIGCTGSFIAGRLYGVVAR